MRHLVSTAVAVLFAVVVAPSFAGDPTSDPSMYPLDRCVVSGGEIDVNDMVTKKIDGREMRFCCKRCVKKFDKNPEKYLNTLDGFIRKKQGADYPMDTCPVSGEKLGEMGEPFNHIIGNRLVRLCCENCVEDANKDAEGVIAKLDAAVIAVRSSDYAAATCPVSGEELGSMGEPYDFVFAGKLVRFCCSGCIDDFHADPHGAMAKVAAGGAHGHAGHDHDGHDHSGHNH